MKLKEKEVEVGYLYLTSANQYRAVLAMKGEFIIYAPSVERAVHLTPTATQPFENQPFKKCRIETFAQKDYQVFEFNGTEAIKHQLSESQLAEATAQCNAEAAITDFYAMEIFAEKFIDAGAYIVNQWEKSRGHLKDKDEVLHILTDSVGCSSSNDLARYGYTVKTFYTETRALNLNSKKSFVLRVCERCNTFHGNP